MNLAPEKVESAKQHLKDYSFGDILGKGVAGVVYAGVHLETKQDVAIKLLTDMRAYENEIEYCKKISHAHSVAILSCGVVDSVAYIIFKRIETSLKALLHKWIKNPHQAPPSMRTHLAATMLEQLLPVLEVFQKENILHKDLHEGNVLVDTQELQFYIHDYGVAEPLVFEEEYNRDDVFSLVILAGYMIVLEEPTVVMTYPYPEEKVPDWINAMVEIIEDLQENLQIKVPYDRLIHLAKKATAEHKALIEQDDAIVRKAMHTIQTSREELTRALLVVCSNKGMQPCALVNKSELLMGSSMQILEPHPRAQVFVYPYLGHAYFLFNFDADSIRLRVDHCLCQLNLLPSILRR